MFVARLLLSLALAAPAAADTGDLMVPALAGRIVDTAGLVQLAETQRLAEQLRRLEQTTGVQLVLLTVPALGHEPLEQFSLRAAETYKLGHAGRDDGLLVVAVAAPPAVRLEVGYGLEDIVPDALAAQWADEALMPRQGLGRTLPQLLHHIAAHLDAHSHEIATGRGRGGARNVSQTLMAPIWLGTLLILVLAWVTLGYRALGKRPSGSPGVWRRGAGRSSNHFGEAPRGSTRFVQTLLWAVATLLSGGGGGGRRDDDFRGGGGRFGGGGASGRDDKS